MNKLTETKCKSLLRTAGKYGDGGNLWFVVGDSGTAKWVLRVQVAGKRREMGLGTYPLVSLKQARDDARKHTALAKGGTDPINIRSAQKLKARMTPSFGECATAFIDNLQSGSRNAKHIQQWRNTITQYCPEMLSLSVDSITQEHVMNALLPIWKAKHITAKRLLGRIDKVLGYATAAKWREGQNPATYRGALEYLLPKVKHVVKHEPSLPWQKAPTFWRELGDQAGIARNALAFLILTVARSSELRFMTWGEVDLQARIWTVPAERMKLGVKHTVPLSDAAIKILEAQPKGAADEFVFSMRARKPMSDMTLGAIIKRMNAKKDISERFLDPDGREACPHGFRSTFRMWAAEESGFSRDVAEFALAHKLPDEVEAAYQRGTQFVKRAEMMQSWARYLLNQKS
jgi:integrase